MAILLVSEHHLYCNRYVSNIYNRRIESPTLGETLAAEIRRMDYDL